MAVIEKVLSLVFILGTKGLSSSFAYSEYDHGVDLPTNHPLNIAHQGSSGVLPQQTVEAYTHAVQNGADVIECDVCITKDLRLVCLHESWFSISTNVADVFPEDRINTYFVADKSMNITDYFTVDFTLEELKEVRVIQREDNKDPNYDGLFQIVSIEEYIEVAQNAGRPVGIYPETKEPIWVNSLDIVTQVNTTFEDMLLDVLETHDYTSPTDPCFLQSFNENSIRYMSHRTSLPLIMLLNNPEGGSDEHLEELAEWCYGIGPDKGLVVVKNPQDQVIHRTDLIERAHNVGLRVHAWTFRNEDRHLPWDYEQDPYNEYLDFLQMGIDGFFSDFPGTVSRFLNATHAQAY